MHAADYNLRLVTVNNRDYYGSTPLSTSDFEALRSADLDIQRAMVHARGLEIAAFLLWLIRKENLPRRPIVGQGKRNGGITLLGWSWGNTMTMSFLAQASRLPEEDRSILDVFLRTFTMYGETGFSVWHGVHSLASIIDSARHGLGVPPEVLEGLRPTVRMRESGESMGQNNAYQYWLSGYYIHSPDTLDSFSSLPLEQFRGGLNVGPMLDPPGVYRPSTARMTPTEYAEIIDPSVITRAHPLFHAVAPEIYWDNVEAALWDSTTWPHLKISIVWCDMSPPETVISAWYLSKRIKEDWPEEARKVDVVRFRGANHFVSSPPWPEAAIS